MSYYRYGSYCLCPLDGQLPPGAVPVAAPFAPLLYLVHRDPADHRFLRPLGPGEDPAGEETTDRLAVPGAPVAGVLNTAFPRPWARLPRALGPKADGLRLTLVGLGDVGGTLLTALKLLGAEIDEIGVYDPNQALCRRYVLELGQVLGRPLPRIVLRQEEALFDCDVFLFTASLGVPPVGARGDMRMLQFDRNRALLRHYSRLARQADFAGLFCQISDPVDLLCRSVYLQSNLDQAGRFDGGGLLPEQIVGFGLGVMKARADFMAGRMGLDLPQLAAYGPHGADLVIANHPTAYDDGLSRQLTDQAVHANMEVRDLGFKPYIAPALSSAALSLLCLLRGRRFYGATAMTGVYLGAESERTPFGPWAPGREMDPALLGRIRAARDRLREEEPRCRC